MESTNKNRFKSGEEDAILSNIRKRNNMLILIFLFLIISLTIITGALIICLVQNNNSHAFNKAVGAFCSAANDTAKCMEIFKPLISPKSKTNPNQIFVLSLQTSVEQLENAVSLLSSSGSSVAIKNCSISLHRGLSRIGDALETIRVNLFVEALGDEQRVEMMNRIVAAEKDLKCGESTAVSAVAAKVLRVKEYLRSSEDFLKWHRRVLAMYRISEITATHRMSIKGDLLGICVVGLLQWLFIFCLFWSLFRIRAGKNPL